MNRILALAGTLFATTWAHGAPRDDLVRLVNAYRSVPATCANQRMPAVAALARQAALSNLRITPGTILSAALEQRGYDAAHVQAISISGSDNAAAAFTAAVGSYCRALRSARFTHIGIARVGNGWDIVLAEPAPPRPPPAPPLPPMQEAARATMAAVNLARASPRACGDTSYPAAPLVTLSEALINAALAHSRDMASHNYFSHQSQDGARVSQRASAVGYAWISIGENIAFGQRSVAEVMDSWLTSPGHCANIMNPSFTQMGVGYAHNAATGRPYWTQVFGTPRR